MPLARTCLMLCLLPAWGCASGEVGPAGARDTGTGRDSGVRRDSGPSADASGDSGRGDSGRGDSGRPLPDTGAAGDGGRTDSGGADSGCTRSAECDDSDPCTDDRCLAGSCTHTDNGTCACTMDSECAAMVTPGVCERAACAMNRCVTVPDPTTNGTPCDADGDGCTVDDACAAGVCTAGAPATCDDGLSCTTDTCRSTGANAFACDAPLSGSNCLIGGSCRLPGATNPSNICQMCDAARSSSAWSANAGASCSDGTTCTTGDRCSGAGVCTGTPMRDTFEPNDTRATAPNLGSINDRSTYPAGSLTGTLYPTGDEDWYRYHVSDVSFGSIGPRAELLNMPAGVDYELCAFFVCDTTEISITCTSGNRQTFMGLSGCCSTLAGSAAENVQINPNCTTTDDSGTVYLRIYRFPGDSCMPYTVRWGDN